jgi:hypothetical protein
METITGKGYVPFRRLVDSGDIKLGDRLLVDNKRNYAFVKHYDRDTFDSVGRAILTPVTIAAYEEDDYNCVLPLKYLTKKLWCVKKHAKNLPKIGWDEVSKPKRPKTVETGYSSLIIAHHDVEVVYRLTDTDNFTLFTSKMNGEWEFLSGFSSRQLNASTYCHPDFDSMIAYLMDKEGNRIAIIQERDFKGPVKKIF